MGTERTDSSALLHLAPQFHLARVPCFTVAPGNSINTQEPEVSTRFSSGSRKTQRRMPVFGSVSDFLVVDAGLSRVKVCVCLSFLANLVSLVLICLCGLFGGTSSGVGTSPSWLHLGLPNASPGDTNSLLCFCL